LRFDDDRVVKYYADLSGGPASDLRSGRHQRFIAAGRHLERIEIVSTVEARSRP